MSRRNCDFNPHFEKLEEIHKKFTASKHVRKHILDPDEAFYNLIQSEFKMPLETLKFNVTLSKGDIKGFEDRLTNIRDSAEAGVLSGKLASLFYTPEAFSRKDPMIGKLLDNYLHTSHHYTGRQTVHREMQHKINLSLDQEMIAMGFKRDALTTMAKKITKQDALTKARQYHEEKIKLHVDVENRVPGAQAKYRIVEKKEDQLIESTEYGVYPKFITLIEKDLPKLINKKLEASKKKHPNEPEKWLKWDTKRKEPFVSKDEMNALVDSDGNRISAPMRDALYEYTVLTNDLYNTLVNGTDAYIDNVMMGQSNTNKEHLTKLREKLHDKIMPNFEKGYFPHFTTDLNVDFMDGLMTSMEDLVLSSNQYFNSSMSLGDAISNMEGYISGHSKSRSKLDAESFKYSLDFPGVIEQYASNVDRFNYINTINKNTKEVINKLEGMYKLGNDSAGYGESVVELIHDLHRAATGYNEIKNPIVSNMIRTILGIEFISKIGYNPRSAVRNMSQALLNYVHWDKAARKQADDFYRDPVKDAEVTVQMESLGILYSEARELQESIGSKPNSFTQVKYNKTTKKLEHVPISKSEQVLSLVSGVASKSGVWMAKAENINRKMTYKIAYSQMHKNLEHPEYEEYVKRRYRKKHDLKVDEDPKTGWAKLIQGDRSTKAKNYAVNMTVALHFDYSKFSKAKVMREGAGSVVFQFQQYAFKLFERTKEYWGKAKNDVLADKSLNTENQWRLYKMAIIYGMAPALASAVTGIDFTGLIAHDSAEKLYNTGMNFIGDEEEAKEANFGKGPIIGNIGFPALSTVVNLGHMYNMINIDEESYLSYYAGLQDHHDLTGDPSLYNKLRLLNAFGSRMAFRHLPQLAQGNIGWVVQSELGMHPSKEALDRKKLLRKIDSVDNIYDILDDLENYGR